jgi:hypothetical protein
MASLATSGARTMGVIQIRWKSSDLSILETHPLTAGLRFGETSKTTSGSNPTSSGDGRGEDSSDHSGGGGGGLSAGAKAGIGAGVAVAVLLLCIVAFFFIRRYRANRLDDDHHIQPAEEVQIEAVGGGGGADGARQFSDVNMSVPGEKPVVVPVNAELASHSVSAVPEVSHCPENMSRVVCFALFD